MLTRKEFFSIITISIVLGLMISLVESWNLFWTTTLFAFIAIFVNVAAKKVIAYYLDLDIKVKIWEVKQFWVKKHLHARSPVQVGIFVPLVIKFLSVGLINWMACLTFDASGKTYRAARKHGIYSFYEVSEEEIGWIAAAGIAASIIFGIIFYLIGAESLSKISFTYAFFNMIPIFDLDGAKIFFGSITLWSFLAIVSILGAVATFVI